MKALKVQSFQKLSVILAFFFLYKHKIYAVQYCASQLFGLKKKSGPTDPYFSGHVIVNATFIFLSYGKVGLGEIQGTKTMEDFQGVRI